jgi:hypothetical protein
VPCLVVKDAAGAVTLKLNEGAAVLQWLADHGSKQDELAGAWGSNKRYLVQNRLNFIASEVHASTGPLWNPSLDAESKARQQAVMHKVRESAQAAGGWRQAAGGRRQAAGGRWQVAGQGRAGQRCEEAAPPAPVAAAAPARRLTTCALPRRTPLSLPTSPPLPAEV